MTATEARARAQWIAFAPFVFQASRALRDSGILDLLLRNRAGLTADDVADEIHVPVYGVRVLLEAALSIGLVFEEDGRFVATKTARFVSRDPMTRVNMDFTQDVNYAGLSNIDEAIEEGRPAGLRVFGDWPTIYEALAHLPARVRESWLRFDHFYSDRALSDALPIVFRRRVKRLLDVGANTGRWADAFLRHDPELRVTVLDLPGNVGEARRTLARGNLLDRADFIETDVLDEATVFPAGFDTIWLSQFLDCFSEKEIVSILSRCRSALAPDGRVYILEPFSDRQRHDAGAFCLRMTSIYFTVMANGKSRMYRSGDVIECARAAGLEIEAERDPVGICHTLLVCRAAGEAKR